MKTYLYAAAIALLLGLVSVTASAQIFEADGKNNFVVKLKPTGYKFLSAAGPTLPEGFIKLTWDNAFTEAGTEPVGSIAHDCAMNGFWGGGLLSIAYPGWIDAAGNLRPTPLAPTALELQEYKLHLANLTAAIAAGKRISVHKISAFCVILGFSVSD